MGMFPLFRRRRAVIDARPECGTWHAGELAVCIGDSWRPSCRHDPAKGDVLRVAGVREAVVRGRRHTFLSFEGKPADHAWSAIGFRKPVIDATGADEAVEQLIKQARPARAPEPVSA